MSCQHRRHSPCKFSVCRGAAVPSYLLREHAHIHTVTLPDHLVERAAPEPRQTRALAVSDVKLGYAVRPGILQKSLGRIAALQNLRASAHRLRELQLRIESRLVRR